MIQREVVQYFSFCPRVEVAVCSVACFFSRMHAMLQYFSAFLRCLAKSHRAQPFHRFSKANHFSSWESSLLCLECICRRKGGRDFPLFSARRPIIQRFKMTPT
jgi:hypothetical protein